jgi:putative membrane protein
MSTLTTVLAILVALEHLYIMFLETIVTSSGSTSRVFGISIDQLKSKTISTLLKNQGVYNGLIAVLLLVAVWQQDLLWTRLLLGYVVLVALYGSLTSKPNIILKQGGLAILGLICSFI